jgi:hypothetical protein
MRPEVSGTADALAGASETKQRRQAQHKAAYQKLSRGGDEERYRPKRERNKLLGMQFMRNIFPLETVLSAKSAVKIVGVSCI